MFSDFRNEYYPHHAQQYLTLRHEPFFGVEGDSSEWTRRADYPLRYFLWKINRDAWLNLGDWRISVDAVRACVAILENLLADMAADAELLSEDADEEDECCPSQITLIQAQTLELDAFGSWADVEHLTSELVEEWGAEFKITPALEMFDAVMALIHVTASVDALDRGDTFAASALAIKARESYFFGLLERGEQAREWVTRWRMAREGADRAHEGNRRLKAEALTLFDNGSWPSKMQAARAISKQVNRTELVVLRWIREHTRKKAE
ncbi:hypothetical protein [Roseateles microcysteis]|uniref:hypothetical protein n=1 Tax=Roseateles microcysteis TaxID=3119057 RepID=UPI002FE59BA8